MTEKKEQERTKAPVKPSMKRRMNEHDYTQRGIYMLTLAVEGRKPLLGRVMGRVDAPVGSEDAPHVVLSPLGRYVYAEVEHIPRYYPQVRVLAKQVMPDHLHVILFVTEAMRLPLGRVVNGFKAGCRRGMRAMVAEVQGGAAVNLAAPQSGATPDTQGGTEPDTQGGATPNRQGGTEPDRQGGAVEVGGVGWDAAWQQLLLATAQQQGGCILWERGYNDRVLYSKGQLQAMIDYIHDNPRRFLVKHHCRQFFQRGTCQIGDVTVHAFGNLQLLNCPVRLPVKCSRSISPSAWASLCANLMAQGDKGAVLVSPFISPGERQIEQCAVERGIAIIKMVDNGFPPFYKPQGSYFDLCATGHLLLLSPFDYRTEHVPLTRTVCQQLNQLTSLLSSP